MEILININYLERTKAAKRKWWHSPKGKAYQEKLKLKQLAERAILAEIHKVHEELVDTELTPEDEYQEQFIDWCNIQHEVAVKQWKRETLNKRR